MSLQIACTGIIAPLIMAVPEAPLLEEIIPTYSYNLEELQSIKILLAVSCHAHVHNYVMCYYII